MADSNRPGFGASLTGHRPDDGHIEHIHPKSADPSRTFHYSNLAHSCNGVANGVKEKHCGHRKRDRVLVVPPGPGCNELFELSTSGRVSPCKAAAHSYDPGDLERQLLHLELNTASLVEERRAQIVRTMEVLKRTPDDVGKYLESNEFRHILRQMFL